MQTPSVVKYSIDTQIDVFDTQAFTEDQINDTCEYAHACSLSRHSRTHFQMDCNFTDSHRSFPVDSFDYHTASTFAVVFRAAIPKAFHRLPRRGVISSVKIYFPPSLRSNVSPVVSFLTVFSVVPIPLLFFFLCSMDSFILPRTNVTNWYFCSSVLFLLVLSSSFLRLPSPWPSHPTHFHDCAVSNFSSILRGFLDIVSSFLFVRSATISYLSTCRLL